MTPFNSIQHTDRFPSKVMLVGEYGVVVGGSALTIPFHRFEARVRSADRIPEGKEQEAASSMKYLDALYRFIAGVPSGDFHAKPDLVRFDSELHRYWLEMQIPTGYGLGSSGAVSAAVYSRFFQGGYELPLEKQKEDLARIESYFHGKSSGVDALTCFAGHPLYFRADGSIERVHLNPSDLPGQYLFFLLDSGKQFETGPLVSHFLERMMEPQFASFVRNEYLTVNQKLIEVLLGIRDADAGLLVRALSDYQFKHFRKMIPDHTVDLWIEGQVTNEYYLKLNGSGGGFMLGITPQSSRETLENRWKQDLIWIT